MNRAGLLNQIRGNSPERKRTNKYSSFKLEKRPTIEENVGGIDQLVKEFEENKQMRDQLSGAESPDRLDSLAGSEALMNYLASKSWVKSNKSGENSPSKSKSHKEEVKKEHERTQEPDELLLGEKLDIIEEEKQNVTGKDQDSDGVVNIMQLHEPPSKPIGGLFEQKLQEGLFRKYSQLENKAKFAVFQSEKGKKYKFSKTSLYCMDRKNRFRKAVIRIVIHPYFENFVLLCIIANSLSLSFYDYSDRNTEGNSIIEKLGYTFSVIFTFEAIFKIISMGFIINKYSYLRDPWNILDFIIVLAGLVELATIGQGLSLGIFKVLRTLRVLRPLKSIKQVPSMQKLVSALIGSIPELGNVMIFFSFIFILFGIMGLQQFSGTLYGRCRITEAPINATYWPRTSDDKICSNEGLMSHKCGSGYCGNWLDQEINPYEVEDFRTDSSIQYGVSNFDNFFQAIIGVFQVITFDNWTAMMYNFMDGADAVIAIPFFVCLVLFGSFFLINLILAVIMQSFNDIYLAELEEKKAKAQKAELEVAKKYDPDQEERFKKAEEKEKVAQKNMEGGGSFNILGQVLQAAREKKSKEAESMQAQYHGLQNVLDSSDKLQKRKELQKDGNILLKKLERGIQEKFTQTKKASYGIKDEQEVIDHLHNRFDESLQRFKTSKAPLARILSSFAVQSNGSQKAVDHSKDLVFHSGAPNEDEAQRLETQKDQKFLMKFALDLQLEVKENQIKKHIFQSIGQKMISIQNEAKKLREAYEKNQKDIQDEELKRRAKKSELYRFCLKIILSTPFEIFIPFCILLNSFILALDQYPQNSAVTSVQEGFNYAFYAIFFLEMILKFFGLGFKYYFKDNFNSFDCFIVVVSSVDILFSNILQADIKGADAITALRTFRLLRIFKLARQWKEFQTLLKTIGKTLVDIRDFSVLLMLFIFTACLLGREGFSYQVAFDEDNKPVKWNTEGKTYPDATFNSFLDSFLAVFIVLANDGWSTIYIDHYRAVNSVGATVYFVALIMLGQYVMLNLFLAILLNNFDYDSLQQTLLKKHDDEEKKVSRFDQCIRFFCKRSKFFRKQTTLQQKKKNLTQTLKFNQSIKEEKLTKIEQIRDNLQQKLKSNKFEFTILILIILSSICLAFENPLNDPNGTKAQILFWNDLILTSIFTIEVLLKMFAFGVLFEGEQSYLRNSENILDFLVVFVSLISLFLPFDLTSLKILRLLRVLKPIRLIAKNEGLKISIQSLIMAGPQILNVTLINVLFFGTFSIIGISLFKGMYYQCTDPMMDKTIETQWDCYNAGGTWERMAHNFDNFFDAFFSIFSISNTVGWAYTMYRSEEFTTEPGVKNIPGQNQFNTLFFVFFIIIGSFFITNLFVGVVISTYNREKEKLGKNYLLTDNQKKWLEAKILLIGAKPKKRYKEPANTLRKKFFYLAQDDRFDHFITCCIILNTLVLCFKWILQPSGLTKATEILNYMFGIIFFIEIVIKIIGYGRRFNIDSWNIFDLTIVVGTFAGFVLSQVSSFKRIGFTATIIRSFRIGRLFKLFKRNKSLKVIFQTFLISLPAIANVGSLLMLLIYIYAVMGVFLFSESQFVGFLNSHANFKTTPLAALTLFRASTGENWHEIAYSLSRSRSVTYQCDSSPTYQEYKKADFNTIGCGNTWTAQLYFFSYIVLVSLIFLNLFIAIILQSFTDTQDASEKVFNQELKDQYVNAWVYFCPDGDKYMPVEELPAFLLRLGEPLGWGADFKNNLELQEYFVSNLNANLFNEEKDVEFHDMLEQLTLLMIVNQEMDKYLHGEEQEEGENSEEEGGEVQHLSIEKRRKSTNNSLKIPIGKNQVSNYSMETDPQRKSQPLSAAGEKTNKNRNSLSYWEKQGKIKDIIVNEVMQAEQVKDAQIVKELDKKRKATSNLNGSNLLNVTSNSPTIKPKLNSPQNRERRISILKINLQNSKNRDEEVTKELPLKTRSDMPSERKRNSIMDQIPEEEEHGFDEQNELTVSASESGQDAQANTTSQRSIQVEKKSSLDKLKSNRAEDFTELIKQESPFIAIHENEEEGKEEEKIISHMNSQKEVEQEVKFHDEELFDQSNGDNTMTTPTKKKKLPNSRYFPMEVEQSQREEVKFQTRQQTQDSLGLPSTRRTRKKFGASIPSSPLKNVKTQPRILEEKKVSISHRERPAEIREVIQVAQRRGPSLLKKETGASSVVKRENSSRTQSVKRDDSMQQTDPHTSRVHLLNGETEIFRAFQKPKKSAFQQKLEIREQKKMDAILREAEELLREKSPDQTALQQF